MRELSVDELDPVAIRRLLSITSPELKKLSIKQIGLGARTVINKAEKAALNRSIKPQPKLEDCEFSLHYALLVIITNASILQFFSLLGPTDNDLIL